LGVDGDEDLVLRNGVDTRMFHPVDRAATHRGWG
jgi:hypothetical protein